MPSYTIRPPTRVITDRVFGRSLAGTVTMSCESTARSASLPLDKPLVAVVLGNLYRLITGHPDLAALKILARRAEEPLPVDKPLKVSWPPMIYEGLRALREEDWTKPGTIQENSLFDRIRARVIPGRAWTRWIADKKYDEFSATPAALIPHKTDSSAWASTVMTVLRGVLGFTNLLDIKGLRTEGS